MTDKNESKLLNQDEALSFYLESLLGVIPDKEEMSEAVLNDDVNKMTQITNPSIAIGQENNHSASQEQNRD